MKKLCDKTIETVGKEEDVFYSKVLKWIEDLVEDQHSVKPLPDTSSFKDEVYFEKWITYIHDHDNTLNSLLYRHYLFQRICDYPLINKEHSSGLSLCMQFMNWSSNQYFPLYETEVWSKIDPQLSYINQLRKLHPEIKDSIIDLANRYDVTDHQLSRDHASLSSHALIYGLYLICTVLEYKTKIETKSSNYVLYSEIVQTLTDLKGVLFHVPY